MPTSKIKRRNQSELRHSNRTAEGRGAQCSRTHSIPFLPLFGLAAIAVQMEKSIKMRIIADTR